MKRKRIKDYWIKRKERFKTGTLAKNRAGYLRTYEHISHVTVDKEEDNQYVVAYSVAKWYLEDTKRAGITI